MHNIYQKGKVRIMNNLLIFFALPIATILLAIVLQKVLRSPILVGITFFAIYLIVTFAAFDANFLVVAIALTILAFITAVIVNTICRILERLEQCEGDNDNDNNNILCVATVGYNFRPDIAFVYCNFGVCNARSFKISFTHLAERSTVIIHT